MKCRPRSHQHAVQPSNDPAALLGTASPDGTCSCVGSGFSLFLFIHFSSFVCMKMLYATLKTALILLQHISPSSQYFFSAAQILAEGTKDFFLLIKSHIKGGGED